MFLNEEDAFNFLEQLAGDNKPFLFTKYPPTGEFMFSAGDGELIQGTLDKALPEQFSEQFSEHMKGIIDDPYQLEHLQRSPSKQRRRCIKRAL